MDRVVTVTGRGSATAVPDLAVVRVAATHRATSVSDAMAGVGSAVDRIGATAREYTTEDRIASRNLNTWVSHDMNGRPDGFEARHALEIGCPDLAQAGAMITALVASVGSRLQVEGVSLDVSDRSAAERSARVTAYADAVERATHLAELAGVELGPVVSVTEGGGADVRPAAQAMRAMAADVSFEPGETTVDATLTVSFQLAL